MLNNEGRSHYTSLRTNRGENDDISEVAEEAEFVIRGFSNGPYALDCNTAVPMSSNSHDRTTTKIPYHRRDECGETAKWLPGLYRCLSVFQCLAGWGDGGPLTYSGSPPSGCSTHAVVHVRLTAAAVIRPSETHQKSRPSRDRTPPCPCTPPAAYTQGPHLPPRQAGAHSGSECARRA